MLYRRKSWKCCPETELSFWNRLQTSMQVKNFHFFFPLSRVQRFSFLPFLFVQRTDVIFTALQTYTLNEHSSAIISATTQVYLSLGKLIKLCDEVLLSENEENCASLSNENVTEVVDLVDAAIIVSKLSRKIEGGRERGIDRERENFKIARTTLRLAVERIIRNCTFFYA